MLLPAYPNVGSCAQKLYFASLLMVFGVEITLDWLIYSYSKARLAALRHDCSRQSICIACLKQLSQWHSIFACAG